MSIEKLYISKKFELIYKNLIDKNLNRKEMFLFLGSCHFLGRPLKHFAAQSWQNDKEIVVFLSGLFCSSKNFLKARDVIEAFLEENEPFSALICNYIDALIGLNDVEYAQEYLSYLSSQPNDLAIFKERLEQGRRTYIKKITSTEKQVDIPAKMESKVPIPDPPAEQEMISSTSQSDTTITTTSEIKAVPDKVTGDSKRPALKRPPAAVLAFLVSILLYGGFRGSLSYFGRIIYLFEDRLLKTLKMAT
jgi:hypothetical protein